MRRESARTEVRGSPRAGSWAAPSRIDRVVISCEHASNRVPGPLRDLFAGRSALLESHRGYDPGSLELARRLAEALDCPLIVGRYSRLVVELNRSAHHAALFSEFTRALPLDQRRQLLKRYWEPYRAEVEKQVRDAQARSGVVLHLSVHTFTPVLKGRVRRADVGLLYDPRRIGERRFAERWRDALSEGGPELRIRRNYPYRGVADGLTTHLRRVLDANRYLGIELEVNQRHALGPRSEWLRLQRTLVVSLTRMIPVAQPSPPRTQQRAAVPQKTRNHK